MLFSVRVAESPPVRGRDVHSDTLCVYRNILSIYVCGVFFLPS